MKIVLNDHAPSTRFEDALREVSRGATTLSLAVSYLQVGGWELFRRNTRGLSFPRMRIVCTDQFGLTHPTAVERAIRNKVQIRKFTGRVIYHPKVYLAHNSAGRVTRCLLGSGNLSSSAFTTSVEAGVITDERKGLNTLGRWFDDLFDNRSAPFTPEGLREMEERWRAAAAARARNRLDLRQQLPVPEAPAAPEDIDTLEDVFATIQLPIGLLNMDHAGNNIRNIDRAREVIANLSRASGKQKSELKLLGFMRLGALSDLGRRAVRARSNQEFARLWCMWLQETADAELEQINSKLLAAKRVFAQFWQLKLDVRKYFLDNAHKAPNQGNLRRLLQTIELLCNARDVVQELTLDQMQALSRLLQQRIHLPAFIRSEVANYFDNKGTRGWTTDDRCVVPNAWQQAVEIP